MYEPRASACWSVLSVSEPSAVLTCSVHRDVCISQGHAHLTTSQSDLPDCPGCCMDATCACLPPTLIFPRVPPPTPFLPCRTARPQTQRLSHPCLTRAPACCPYLHGQLLTTGHMKESRSIVILIQHSDIDGSCGTAGWCSPILHDHQELVAGLLLPVQAMLGAELPCEGEVGHSSAQKLL